MFEPSYQAKIIDGTVLIISGKFYHEYHIHDIYADPAYNELESSFNEDTPIDQFVSELTSWINSHEFDTELIAQLRAIKQNIAMNYHI